MIVIMYVVFLVLVLFLSYSIYRDIVAYKTGKDSIPKEHNFFRGILIIMALFFAYENGKEEIIKIIFLVYISISIIKTIVLGYLNYKKTKDNKIISSTFITDLVLVGMGVFIFNKILRV